jgi:hypothetical protein
LPCEPGAAAEIEHASKSQSPGLPCARLLDRRAQQRRSAVGEAFDQRLIEIRRVLVEHRAHVMR